MNRQLYYLRARYYDPALGRFLSADPFRGWVVQPQTQNRFPYVGNNPANLVDPYGLIGLGAIVDAVVPDPVEDFVTDTAPDWIYEHRYEIAQGAAGVAIVLSCAWPPGVVCVVAYGAYLGASTMKVTSTEGRCEETVAGVTGFIGAIPASGLAGKLLAASSGAVDGVGCASPVYAGANVSQDKE